MRFGIEAVDQDHERLLELASTVLLLLGPHSQPDEARQVFYELVDYTLMHFAREEALMQRYRYRNLPGHRAEHREIAAWLRHLQERLEVQGESIAAHTVGETVSVLRAWVVEHLSRFDAPAMQYIKDQCLSADLDLPTTDEYQRV